MSLICIGMAKSVLKKDFRVIRELQEKIVNEAGMGVFYSIDYEESVVNTTPHNFLFSLADDYEYDNCEMLLLLDGWTFNGQENSVPFRERASYIQNCVKPLSDLGYEVKLFLGTSGDTEEDYQLVTVGLSELADALITTWGVYGEGKDYCFVILPRECQIGN